MDVPAFQQIPMDGLEFDRSDNRHIQITSSLSFEDEMSELYEAFYPSTTPHPLQINSVPEPFQHNYPPPELTTPSDVSSQLEQRQQLAALLSLQAQHQFQARQEHYYLQHQQQQQQQQQQNQRKSGGIRKKRKMDQLKTVYRVPAENILTVDKWAWRKYGQKPIKGSPFPRNYYRCSSSKGCTARKQVERSITEPEVYVVTYTGDHFHPWPIHRNALAGISRSSSHRIGCAVTHDLSCDVAAAASPNSDPPPTNSEDDVLPLIPNRKYVDEDMLRGMEELGKWKTTTSTTPNASAIDGRPPTGFLLG